LNAIRIEPSDDLRAVAFKVCTALERAGAKAVLTGGSAATVYAPQVYQSRDADFIAYVVKNAAHFRRAVLDLGFEESGRVFTHPSVPITLDFPDEDIRIGSELVDRYETLHEDGLILHVLNPTDCVRDRLASFFWYHDRSALVAACGVAKAQSAEVDLEEIEAWAGREGESERYAEFLDRLNRIEL
jgi:hypothetical protein